jgi:hypothetical protein
MDFVTSFKSKKMTKKEAFDFIYSNTSLELYRCEQDELEEALGKLLEIHKKKIENKCLTN